MLLIAHTNGQKDKQKQAFIVSRDVVLSAAGRDHYLKNRDMS